MPDAAPATDAPARPRTKPAEVRLDELMAAAERLFLDKGVEATTVGDITSLADVAKGTFYHYFPSKHEMLAALAGRYTQHFLASLEAAIGLCMPNDWEGRLRAWVQANVATYLRTWQLHDIVYTSHRRSIGIEYSQANAISAFERIEKGALRVAEPSATNSFMTHRAR